MNEIALPDYDELDAQVTRLALGQDPSELHGALCGYLSGGSPAPGRDAWLGTVMADDAPEAIERDSALDRMYVASEALIESPDFGFDLLLPSVDRPVRERGDADEFGHFLQRLLVGFGIVVGQVAGGHLRQVGKRVAALLLHSDCVLAPRHRRSLN